MLSPATSRGSCEAYIIWLIHHFHSWSIECRLCFLFVPCMYPVTVAFSASKGIGLRAKTIKLASVVRWLSSELFQIVLKANTCMSFSLPQHNRKEMQFRFVASIFLYRGVNMGKCSTWHLTGRQKDQDWKAEEYTFGKHLFLAKLWSTLKLL